MNVQSCAVIMRVFIFVFLVHMSSLAIAQQQQEMTPASGDNGAITVVQTGEDIISHLHLNVFDGVGNSSACAGDESCSKNVEAIKTWICAESICSGSDKSKELTTCFHGIFDKYPFQDRKQIAESICPAIKSPSNETRRALLAHVPHPVEDEADLVESIAYILALKVSAASCEDYIKNYVGAYGPQWKYEWYRALSGCRILAKQRTSQEEEKDITSWLGGNCSNIVNLEMRTACSTPGTSFSKSSEK